MKIKPEHYQHMLDAIKTVDFQTYLDRLDLTARRNRWDLLYAANLSPFICEHVYPYANDDHIDTALRNIVKELTP